MLEVDGVAIEVLEQPCPELHCHSGALPAINTAETEHDCPATVPSPRPSSSVDATQAVREGPGCPVIS